MGTALSMQKHTITLTALCLFMAGCQVQMDTGVDLDDFELSTNAVDVTSAAQTVTCTLDISGGTAVKDAWCVIAPPSGVNSQGCLSLSPTPDACGAGCDVWACSVTIPKDAEANTWAVDYVGARSTLPPYTPLNVSNAELVAGSLPGVPNAAALDVEVTSPGNDVNGPAINDFTVLPASVEPGDPVTCSIDAADPSDILDRGCTFDSTDGTLSCIAHAAATSCVMNVPSGADAGVTWNEVNHFARDTLANLTLVEGSASFDVTGAGGSGGGGGAGGESSCDAFVYDYRAISGWSSTQSVTAATTTVTFDYWAKVDAANQDSLVAFAENDTIIEYDAAAMLIRFNNAGLIDVRDGSGYGCPGTTCPAYLPDVWYHFEVTANIETDLYTVDVTPCDGAKVSVAINAAFRTGAPSASIGYHAANSSDPEYIEVDQVTWTPGSCTPDPPATTCTGDACGTVINNCGTPVDCDVENGTCDSRQSGDVCFNNTCCTPETAATTCTGGACGNVNNNCGETVDCDVENGTCDSRVPGEVCEANVCVEPSGFARPTVANTGPHDIASLTAYTGDNPITTPGTYSDFYYDTGGTLFVSADDVTLENFSIRGITSAKGLWVTGDNFTAVDGEIVKGAATHSGQKALYNVADGMHVLRMHMDSCGTDCVFIEGTGTHIFESTLFTRSGADPNVGCGAHADVVQTAAYPGGGRIDFLGNRIVPTYCSCGSGNYYKQSNTLQPDGAGGSVYYHDNNWYDGASNYMIGPGGTHYFKNNKFGNVYNRDMQLWSSGTWWPGQSSWTEANNTWECDDTVILDAGNSQPSCYLFAECGGNGAIGNCPSCTGSRDNYPIDPIITDSCEDLYCAIHGTGTYNANSCSASPVVCP